MHVAAMNTHTTKTPRSRVSLLQCCPSKREDAGWFSLSERKSKSHALPCSGAEDVNSIAAIKVNETIRDLATRLKHRRSGTGTCSGQVASSHTPSRRAQMKNTKPAQLYTHNITHNHLHMCTVAPAPTLAERFPYYPSQGWLHWDCIQRRR